VSAPDTAARVSEASAVADPGPGRAEGRLGRDGGAGWGAGGERRQLALYALFLFALNKAVVLPASAYGLGDRLDGLSPLAQLRLLFLESYMHWDTYWYIQIATKGYDRKATAFFPFFPSLMKVVGEALGLIPLAAGVLIAHVAFALLLYWFLRLVRLDFCLRETRVIGLLLALYPTAFYFSAPYTESLFVLFMVLTLWQLRRGRWGLAAGAGFLAALTRNTGILLVIPFVIEFVAQTRPRHAGWGDWLRGEAWKGSWVALIGAAGLGYMAYLWRRFGDAFSFAHVQPLYGREFMAPWEALVRGYYTVLANLVRTRPPLHWPKVYYPLELWFVSWVLAVLVTSFRRMRWSYWAIVLYSFLVPLSSPSHMTVTDYFVSFSRYSLSIVPLYIGLWWIVGKRRVWLALYLLISVGLLALLTYHWARGDWVA